MANFEHKQIEKKFGKYRVELETNYNGEGGTDCRIYYKTAKRDSSAKREYSASLQVALDYYELESNDGCSMGIESAIVDDIEQWAIENGY